MVPDALKHALDMPRHTELGGDALPIGGTDPFTGFGILEKVKHQAGHRGSITGRGGALAGDLLAKRLP